MRQKLLTTICAALLCMGAGPAWADVNADDYKLTHPFSVSATKVVYFSQGNLQYKASTGTWRFATHQYDYVGNTYYGNVYENEVKCSNTLIASDYSGWIDLFGWATSGWNSDNRAADQPYSTSGNTSDYGVTATKSEDETLTGDYANGDWGVYNASQLGSGWRTLTNDEWCYLFNTRATGKTVNGTSDARYTKAKILTDGSGTDGLTKNIYGIILFPDDFDGSASYGSEGDVTWGYINNSFSTLYTKCTTAGWAALEAAGCVFLPAGGYRIAGSNPPTVQNAGSSGSYWSSTAKSSTNAYCFGFTQYGVSAGGSDNRHKGFSVRLVSETAPPTPATVTTAPTAKSLTYNGSAQALVNAGTASGGTMNYSLDNSSWSTSIPTATNADDYTVYYKVVGDASHTDYTPSPNTVSVTINKADAVITDTPAAIEGLVYTGAAQTLISAGTATGGELQYKLDDGAYGTSLPQATAADTYTIYYKVDGDGNHNDVAETSFTVTISGPTDQVLTANQDPNRTSDYYSTFYHSAIQYSLPEGTQAYIATLDGDALNLTKIAQAGDVLPADNAVILKASGSSITLTPSDADPVTFDATNNLRGVDEATAAPSNCYVLSGRSSDNSVIGVGFYLFTGTIPAHKAYVVIGGGGAGAPKRLRFVFNETNTATDTDQVQRDEVQSTKVLRNGQLIIIRGDKEYNAQGQMIK